MVEEINISKVIKLGNSLAIVIPKEICKKLHISKGFHLGIQLEGNKIIIKKVGKSLKDKKR
ncbi:MAG: AbrB/MazE/SpoVT family DNA-binding domain-containing protein [Promethearchaeota archaeon]|jgi:AbrB family looped-hinge helix DNA binding protein